MEKIDEQHMSEKIASAKEVKVMGIRGTGYEGDILDLLVDNEVYFICIDQILKPPRKQIEHLLRGWGSYGN